MTKYFDKSKQIKQNWTQPEKFDICFCVSSDRYCQNLNFWKGTGHLSKYPPCLEIFYFYPIFKNPKS